MSALVVVGAQWGDEGKGKVVDLYAQYADVVVRYGGGANAGHTLVVGGEKVVLHLVPSGALHERTRCVIGQGTVIDPKVLVAELDAIAARGLLKTPRILISDRAHVVLPHHFLIDGLRDEAQGIGTTKRGIGPTYEDKVARRGIRIGDLLRPAKLESLVRSSLEAWQPVLQKLGGEAPRADDILEPYLAYGERIRPYVTDTAAYLGDCLERGEKILLEGAQGTMLDVDHGTYPYVTSSTVIAGGACAGSGLGPTAIKRVVGITKAYTTRVGGGPMPTELTGAEGDRLREAGAEFGATTGRPRRCGWLDIPALRFAVRINGMTDLALTKLDVLSGLKELRLCTGYERDGEPLLSPPYDGLEEIKPIYEAMPGWDAELQNTKTVSDLPEAARNYLRRIEELVGCPITMVSVGADRKHTLGVMDPFVAS